MVDQQSKQRLSWAKVTVPAVACVAVVGFLIVLAGCGGDGYPRVLRGTDVARGEAKLQTVSFGNTGELEIVASSRRWSEDTSIGLQLWHPDEDGIVFRGGYIRIIVGGQAVVNREIENWANLSKHKHTYKMAWDKDKVDFSIDGSLLASYPRSQCPAYKTKFQIRFNADYTDSLTVHSCEVK